MNRRDPSIQWGARCLPRGGGDLPWAADQADNPAADVSRMMMGEDERAVERLRFGISK